MLRAVESMLLLALEPLVQAGVTVRAGAVPRPSGGCVDVRATRLRLDAPEGDEPPAPRRTPRLLCAVEATAVRPGWEWSVPWAEGLEVVEVQGPQGAVLRVGDEYELALGGEGELRVRLYRGLSGGGLRVVLGGAEGEGFEHNQPGRVTLRLSAWAADAVAADALLGEVLRLALPALANPGELEADWSAIRAGLPVGGGVRLRLRRPWVGLEELRQRWEPGEPSLARAEAKLLLRGTVDLWVALGAAEPWGRIERILGLLELRGRAGEPASRRVAVDPAAEHATALARQGGAAAPSPKPSPKPSPTPWPALAFAGGGHVGFGTAPALAALTGALTVELWVRVDARPEGASLGVLYARGVPSSAANGGLLAVLSDGRAQFQCGMRSSTSSSFLTRRVASAQPLPLGVWTHLAAVRDPAQPALRLYVNGVLEAELALTGVTGLAHAASTAVTALGASSALTEGLFGALAEVRVWGRVRSAEELSAAARNRARGDEPDLAACWPLSEGVGETVHDRGPAALVGAVSGGSWGAVDSAFGLVEEV